MDRPLVGDESSLVQSKVESVRPLRGLLSHDINRAMELVAVESDDDFLCCPDSCSTLHSAAWRLVKGRRRKRQARRVRSHVTTRVLPSLYDVHLVSLWSTR
jgi:hypothetical protein